MFNLFATNRSVSVDSDSDQESVASSSPLLDAEDTESLVAAASTKSSGKLESRQRLARDIDDQEFVPRSNIDDQEFVPRSNIDDQEFVPSSKLKRKLGLAHPMVLRNRKKQKL